MIAPLTPQTPSEPDPIVLLDSERQPCEIYTRVMGYHRPISAFNIGKKGEVSERKYFRPQEPLRGP